MNCRKIEEWMVDDLDRASNREIPAGIEDHLASCDRCRREVRELGGLWRALGALPEEEPSELLRARFRGLLDGRRRVVEGAERPPNHRRSPPRLWPAGLAAAALLAGVVLGSKMAPVGGEVGELRREVAELTGLVGRSLLERESATDRLRGLAFSRRSATPDPRLLEAVIGALERDPRVNVRLAALEAIGDLADRPRAGAALRSALDSESEPMVQLALADRLLELGDPASLGAVGRLLDDPALHPTVRRHVEERLRAEGRATSPDREV